eukprot:TRINITY_DN3238_c0_g2_i4.p3 TRINITY_DN3238_c0_g2~~TRINITY_DN3238_c0_g2_i4.p3  ORF type:complete len:106 (+),score=10.27 TRINITY_DN3238_c0_g2_i4:644-961(+)
MQCDSSGAIFLGAQSSESEERDLEGVMLPEEAKASRVNSWNSSNIFSAKNLKSEITMKKVSPAISPITGIPGDPSSTILLGYKNAKRCIYSVSYTHLTLPTNREV